MQYHTIPEMLEMIDEPNRTACLKLYQEHLDVFNKAQGSSCNHQAWVGGYHDHVQEVMNVCLLLYPVYSIRKMKFSLSDALLVMFLHDVEKPFKARIADVAEGEYGAIPIKLAKEIVRNKIIKEYNINLTEQQQNAMKYVEGENLDYSNKQRVMNELAAFCHIADVSSARIWHKYPKWPNRNGW